MIRNTHSDSNGRYGIVNKSIAGIAVLALMVVAAALIAPGAAAQTTDTATPTPTPTETETVNATAEFEYDEFSNIRGETAPVTVDVTGLTGDVPIQLEVIAPDGTVVNSKTMTAQKPSNATEDSVKFDVETEGLRLETTYDVRVTGTGVNGDTAEFVVTPDWTTSKTVPAADVTANKTIAHVTFDSSQWSDGTVYGVEVYFNDSTPGIGWAQTTETYDAETDGDEVTISRNFTHVLGPTETFNTDEPVEIRVIQDSDVESVALVDEIPAPGGGAGGGGGIDPLVMLVGGGGLLAVAALIAGVGE